ncbi:MAG TPA: hypothetical protein VF778_12455 [Xanthobacteraceae bacterium]
MSENVALRSACPLVDCLIFNFARFLAMFGPILASSLIGFFGGYGPAATILASIFALGLVVLPLLPETKGQPLPT